MRAKTAAAVVLSLGLASILETGCGNRPALPLEEPGTLATVEGRPVTRDELDRFVAERLGGAATEATPDVLSSLFDQFVEEEILASKSRTPLVSGKIEARSQARRSAAEAFLQRAADSAPPVTPGEVDDDYAAHPERFEFPERIRIRQIEVATEAAAREAQQRLKAGDSFIAVSKKLSRAPNADKGGMVGTITRGQLPLEFEQVVFRLKPKEWSPTVSAPSGYHIFLIESRDAARTIPLAEVREALRQELERERKEEWGRRAVSAALAVARVELAPDHFPFRYKGRWNPALTGAPETAIPGREKKRPQ